MMLGIDVCVVESIKEPYEIFRLLVMVVKEGKYEVSLYW